jgi:hypothetical protein
LVVVNVVDFGSRDW